MKSKKKVDIKFGYDSEKGNELILAERRGSSPKEKYGKKYKEISTADREYINEIHPVNEPDIGSIKCDPHGSDQTKSPKKKHKKRKHSKSATETEETFGSDQSKSTCPHKKKSVHNMHIQTQSTSHLPVEPQSTSQHHVSRETPSEFSHKSEKNREVQQIKQEIVENAESCDVHTSIDDTNTTLLSGKRESYCVKKSKKKKRRMGSDGLVSDRKVSGEQMSHGRVSGEPMSHGQVSGEQTSRIGVSGERISDGQISGKQTSQIQVSGEQMSDGQVTGEQMNDGDARVFHNQEASGSSQEVLVKKTDLFVSPEADLVIHSVNTVDGKGKAEKLLRAKLQDQGIHLRTGRWTAIENERLKSNWEEIIKNHPVSNPYSLLTRKSSGDRDQQMFLKTYIQETSFYKALARGLNRSTYSCYIRARRMFHKLNKGSYTEEDFRRLKRLRQEHGNKWTQIGKLMDRTGSSLFDMHRRRVNSTRAGYWSTEEEIQLLDAIRAVMGSADVTHLYHQIPWQQVAGHVPTRSAPQCREHWWKKMAWTVNNEGYRQQWRSCDRKKLVEKIYVMPIFEESEIDWDALHLMFDKSVSPQYLQKRWFYLKTLVPNFQRKSFDEIRDFLYNRYDDEGSGKEDTTRQ
ncbi:cyclin-D-binding Myb-like transcription factor 1 [Liolophura sinensis]|uniref:cyclin-D-binding Myb-like transcription factor 1 n=1 Tax=Liolophura sinensis TaxID=3198878 RepID=UPI0031581365